MSVVSMLACSSLCVVPLLGVGCAGGDHPGAGESAVQTGALSLPLTALGASGAVYRLRQGVFSVTEVATGTQTLLSTEQDPLASTLEASLDSGDYFVALQNGWVLEKAVGNTLTIVQATLVSPAVQSVTITANGEAALNFQFDTNGEIGTGLSAQDIAARARFAGSCIGCHQESSGSPLGHGITAPFQSDFVHVSERFQVPCDDGIGSCFAISDALRNEFLPHRQQVMSGFLGSSPGCSPLPPPGFLGSAGQALSAPAGTPVRTLGGQTAGAHSH